MHHVRSTPTSGDCELFGSNTTRFSHWYWPLGAEMGADGRVYVFLAEMFERGQRYLTRVEPVSTVVAGIDIDTMEVEFEGSPANSSAALYGFSIESDSRWTYLYAQCHRQFGFDPYIWVGVSHNRWDGIASTVYRPTFATIGAPSRIMSSADRCSIGHCG